MHRPLKRAWPLAAIGCITVGLSTAGPAAAHPQAARGVPVAGQFNSIAAVKGSSKLYAVGQVGSYEKPIAQERVGGKWKNLKLPKTGFDADPARLSQIIAPSTSKVFAVGRDDNYTAWLGQLKGKRFKTVKALPGIDKASFGAMASSSPNNIWLTGRTSTSPDATIAAHWNGKKWSQSTFPKSADEGGIVAVATAGAHHTWATDGHSFYKNAGKNWTTGKGRAPLNSPIVGVAVHGTHGFAVGSKRGAKAGLVVYQPYAMRLKGSTWKQIHTPRYKEGAQLYAVSSSGKETWAVGYREADQVSFSGADPLVLVSKGGKFKPQKIRFGKGIVGGFLYSVSAVTLKNVIAAGSKGYDGDYDLAIAIYNGKKWDGQSAR